MDINGMGTPRVMNMKKFVVYIYYGYCIVNIRLNIQIPESQNSAMRIGTTGKNGRVLFCYSIGDEYYTIVILYH